MKRFFLTATGFMFLAASSPGHAKGSLVVIDTPLSRHAFSDCALVEYVIQRSGTVATLIVDCTSHAALPQVPQWEPGAHPDGAPLLWETRVRVSDGLEPFMQCTLLNLVEHPEYRALELECLDDPLPVGLMGDDYPQLLELPAD